MLQVGVHWAGIARQAPSLDWLSRTQANVLYEMIERQLRATEDHWYHGRNTRAATVADETVPHDGFHSLQHQFNHSCVRFMGAGIGNAPGDPVLKLIRYQAIGPVWSRRGAWLLRVAQSLWSLVASYLVRADRLMIIPAAISAVSHHHSTVAVRRHRLLS